MVSSPGVAAGDEGALVRECHLFTAYLIGAIPSQEVVERYRKASQVLLAGVQGSERKIAFVRRHPWALSFLDAACGLLQRDDLLRKKLLMLMAILEATPCFADHFLPPTSKGLFSLLAGLAWNGVSAGVKVIVGVLLWPLVL